MTGFITEVEKDFLYRLEFDRPFRRAAAVKRGKARTTITLDNGDKIHYPNDTGCQYKTKIEQSGMLAKEEKDAG